LTPVRGAQAVAASLRDFPLTLKKKYAKSDVLAMKMIRIIQYLHLFNMKGQICIQFVILDP